MQHVEDEALLDGLLHRVEVERLGGLPVRALAAEQLQRLGLRGGGEREEGDVLRLGALGHLGRQHRLDVDLAAVGEVLDLLGGEDALQLARRRPVCEEWASSAMTANFLPFRPVVVADLVQREREGLDGDDDDELAVVSASPAARTSTSRRPCGRPRGDRWPRSSPVPSICRIASCSWASRTLRSVTTMTESNTFSLSSSCRRRQPVRGPGDRVRLARPGGVLDQVAVPGPSVGDRGDEVR